MITLEKMIGLALQQAERVLIGTKEELVPSWLLVTGEGKVEIFATPWRNTQEKHLTVAAMREVMSNRQCTAYSLLTEAWYSRLPASEAGKEYTGPPPSERPDRQEAVVVTAANHWGQTVFRQWEIVRDQKGRTRELRRLDGPEDLMTSALFDNLLESRRPN